ncbi:MAG TPA: hypothetical protein VLK84_07730 [Longimicrobium sp.]|nr:hypothetical protein [Longimicrobium sp.]
MTTIPLRSVRFAFLMLLLVLTAFVAVESAVGGPAAGTVAEGLSTCGSMDQPCTLEAVAVSVPAAETAPVQVAADAGLSDCGSKAQPCRLEAVEVTADASPARLASVEHAVGMTLRVRS